MDSVKITSRGIDPFWVVSSIIHITPAQQLEYLKKLYYGQPPFSQHNISIVEKLMYEKDIKGYSVYGKRGSYTLLPENKYLGWFIGYVTKGEDVRFFVNYIQTKDLKNTKLIKAQKEIVFQILKTSNILEQLLLRSKDVMMG